MLKINDLYIRYRSDSVPAVSRLSFRLEKGRSLGIMGESGCGKTTLALGIMGLLRGADITGEILLDGENLLKMSGKQRKGFLWRKIAIVFQNSLEVFNPVMNIGEQIGESLMRHFSMGRRDALSRARKLLSCVGLDSGWANGYPHQLSGGMRQRVLIAMAVACEPELLVVDEPTTALDPESRSGILELIGDLQKEMGFSMIMISHDLSALRQMTSRVLTMYCGQVVEEGVTADVMKNPMHCYTRGLLNASPELFPYKDLWGIDGTVSENGNGACCPFHPRCFQSDAICRSVRPVLRYVSVERRVACHKGGIETVLAVRGVTKTFRLKKTAIRAVSEGNLFIKGGEVVALVGKSGSGKSTLARILVNLLTPDTGEILFMGEKVAGFEAIQKIGGMQIVFQDPFSSTSNRMKTLAVVREPLDIIGWKTPGERDREALRALAMVRLPASGPFPDRCTHTLSGGQRQRLSIARALVTRPRLLIADEITSMLDPSNRANLMRELKGLQNRYGFSMLYITHDVHLAKKVADRAYVMDNGIIEPLAENENRAGGVLPIKEPLSAEQEIHPYIYGKGEKQ